MTTPFRTREDLDELLSRHLGGLFARDVPTERLARAVADLHAALLARLRPAWKRQTEEKHEAVQSQQSGSGVPPLRSGRESSRADSLVVSKRFDWSSCRQRITDTILDRYDPAGIHATVDEVLAHVQRALQPIEAERDALRADLEAAHKEIDALGYARHDSPLAERLNLVLSEPDFDPDREVAALKASLARKDEALRACADCAWQIKADLHSGNIAHAREGADKIATLARPDVKEIQRGS